MANPCPPSSSGDNPLRLRRLNRADLAPLLLIALAALFFYRLAFTDLILARGDTFAYFYPYWHVRNAALLSGQLPLWSPNLFMGVPLLGNSQLGTFYPPNWLVAPLTPPDGIRVSILLHAAWAGIGVYALARRALGVSVLAALTAAILFVFGGHVLGHVEQINQIQGLAWLPWLLYLFDRALQRPLPYTLLLAMGFALQFFTGHTQTVFISGVALAIYALCTRPIRGALTLALAGGLAIALAVPQLLPTLELTGVSNRRGGLNVNQATAFSFSPFVTGRGLLPSYDAPIFTEYLAYPGVIGLGLALVGVLSAQTQGKYTGLPLRRRWRLKLPLAPRTTWLIMALVGLALAYGLYNPLYWLLAGLPGFNLFRVPARWLALFALGAAMLAALGMEWLKKPHPLTPSRLRSEGEQTAETVGELHVTPLQKTTGRWRSLIAQRPGGSIRFYLAILLIIGLLAASSALSLRQNDGTPARLPTTVTLIGWGAALAVLLIGLWRRWPLPLAGAALVELWLAASVLPYNQLVPPEAYGAQRFSESTLIAANAGQTPPGRILSISGLLFDPGDRAALEARYAAAGLSPEAVALAFDTVKMRETIAANQPLIWGIPSADGFDGGLLPTAYYTAFTSLLLPPGELRTVDGRLREILAQPECGGACIPDLRWLNLMNVRSLLTDKIYDLVQDGIFYDTQFATTSATYRNPQAFVADAVDVLCAPCDDLIMHVDGEELTPGESEVVGVYTRLRFPLDAPAAPGRIVVQARSPFRAATLVDTRTGDFQQLAPSPWQRVLSSDIKLYENQKVLPRAFLTGETVTVPDSEAGTEQALRLMVEPSFSPAQTVILAGDDPGNSGFQTILPDNASAAITEYADTRVVISVDAADPGYLLLTDAYYPGWVAAVNGQETPIERADIMFRAVRVPAGQSEVVFEYRPAWLPGALIVGGAAWLAALVAALVTRKSKRLMAS